jgi:hypothetical protein
MSEGQWARLRLACIASCFFESLVIPRDFCGQTRFTRVEEFGHWSRLPLPAVWFVCSVVGWVDAFSLMLDKHVVGMALVLSCDLFSTLPNSDNFLPVHSALL